VVVHNFNIKGIVVFPAQTDPPLVVDADAVLPFAVALQCSQPVSRRNLEFVKALCLMQVQELAAGATLNRPEPAVRLGR